MKKNLYESTQYFDIDEQTMCFELKGRVAESHELCMVSKNFWHIVSKFAWYKSKSGYAFTYIEGSRVQLHRFIYTLILGESIPEGFFIDHIDSNKLNNSNSNLRLATPQENSFNKSSKSGTKGIKKNGNKYVATITKDGKTITIPNIPTEEQAKETYNMMAEELFGVFAKYN